MHKLVKTTIDISLKSNFAGKLDKKYISAENKSVFVKFSKKFLRVLMLETKKIPKIVPNNVPRKPIAAPFKKNIFKIIF